MEIALLAGVGGFFGTLLALIFADFFASWRY